MFEPLIEIWKWIGYLVPSELKFKRPRLSFIMVHYMYLIILTIIGSIMLFPAGGMAYIDALFFAAGMATQSGLNTLNVNQLNTYQQVVMMLLTCIGTPIFINTVVVFVRLYWFEKRFTHIVKEIRSQRRSKTRSIHSRTQSRAKAGEAAPDLNHLELGVNGRQIVVLHETTVPNGMSGTTAQVKEATEQFGEKLGLDHLKPGNESSGQEPPHPNGLQRPQQQDDDVPPDKEAAEVPEDDAQGSNEHSSDSNQPTSRPSQTHEPLSHREITFADELAPEEGNPEEDSHSSEADQFAMAKHIRILEKQQQNARTGGALHIPGPRDFDRGEKPKVIDDDGWQRPRGRSLSIRSGLGRRKSLDSRSVDPNAEDNVIRRGITIDEPDHPGRRIREAGEDKDDTGTSTILERWKSTLSHRRVGRRGAGEHGTRNFPITFSDRSFSRSREKIIGPSPYLSWAATTGRNSAFLGLTETQREELGGIEYRALKTLAGTLLFYFFGFHLLGLVIFTAWIHQTHQWKPIVEADGINPIWWGIFTPASAFNDLGFTLTPDSMESFQTAVVPLLFGSFFVIIGNTGFPCMLRFVIWLQSTVVPYGSGLWEELRFLLDHPRRCFTLLFPSRATWWLFWVLVLLNGIDLLFFVVLDLHDSTVTSLAPGYRVLNGWFQAASTRTAGFACVNLADLHPAIQVSYMIMMYISVFPIAISVRRTNVYEEQSLGIFGGEEEREEGEPSYVGQHLRRQLSFDLWFIFMGFFIIAIAEGGRIADQEEPFFSMFAVLFEIVSSYGTVGLSLGYPGIDESFSAEFNVVSKLVIIAMMIRGRHRGLPYALDRAILLPSEKLQQKETAEGKNLRRRGSAFSEYNADEFNNQHGAWSDAELDENGLPKQHVHRNRSNSEPQSAAGATIDQQNLPDSSKPLRPRRKDGFGRLLAAGLSAGPSYSKFD